MRKLFSLCSFDIQLFADGGGAAGGTGSGAAGATGATAAAAGQQTSGESADLSNVVYGKQTAPVDAGQTKQTSDPAAADDRAAKFREMIKGEYKEYYDAEVQNIIKNRFKNAEAKAAQFDKATQALDRVFAKYGVESGDYDALSAALDGDDSLWEDEAFERGMTVEQLKRIKKMEQENRALKEQITQRQNQEQADRLLAAWQQQAEETKAVYPDFDFSAEVNGNPKFKQLLQSNVDVKTAYEVIHLNDVLSTGMNMAARHAERKVASSVAAGARRPAESGVSKQGATIHKTDVTKFTKADRKEIIRRVQRGEKIIL